MKFLIAIAVLTTLLGCSPRVEYKETVTVVAISYKGAETNTGIGPAIGGKGGIAVTVSSSPAQYNVILDCPKHGRIIVDSRTLFNHVKPDQQVIVVYRDFWYGAEHDAN
jgi:hypothetical protein